jgi:polyvinyl alcohol dehydrogenase (cytochrome)
MNSITRRFGAATAAVISLSAFATSGSAQSADQPAARANTAAVSGADVYKQRCASCHDQPDARMPARAALEKLSPARILKTLDFGAMMSIAYPLRRDEREAVARFLGHGASDPPLPATAFCRSNIRIMRTMTASWSGWSPTTANTRYQSSATAGLTASDVPKLQLKWAFGFAGDVTAFAAPTVVNGTLFVGSAGGTVHAIDAETGCLHWAYDANAPVRSAMAVIGAGAQTRLVFSDQIGGVHALNARTGKRLWKVRSEAHEATRLTATPAVHNNVVFVAAASWEETRSIDPNYPCCTFRGSITALRASDGGVVWKTYLVDPPKETGKTSVGTPTFGPSGAGVWAAPTIDALRGVLYITTGDNYSHPATATSDAVVALDMKTGRIVWSQQVLPNDVYNSACGSKGANCPANSGPDFDFGSSAMLVRTSDGRDLLVAGQKSGVVYALDPERKGAIVWQMRVGRGSTNGGVQWGMASDGMQVYAAVSDVVRPPGGIGGAAQVGNAGLDPRSGGGLTALDISSGTRAWFAPPAPCDPPRPGCSPAQPGAVTAIDGAVFSGSMDGHLRAFSTVDGRVLWDYDTARSYMTTNGLAASGGSLDGAGPVIAGGMLFVNSGYPRFGGMPGNVLLAFEVPGRQR